MANHKGAIWALMGRIRTRQLVRAVKPLERLVKQGELMSFVHEGFWQCMDNIREKEMLEKLWKSGNAPWKKW